MEVWIALLVTVLIGICLSICFQTNRKFRLDTLAYVSDIMNHVSDAGGREEMRRFSLRPDKNVDLVAYINDDPARAQRFLEYIYALQRIGTGVRLGILDLKTITECWLPSWFVGNWKAFEPFVSRERARRKDVGNDLYRDFQWLAQRCAAIEVKK